MERYILTEKQLKELLNGYLRYTALDNGGVDNWMWYSESIDAFLADCNAEDIEEVVEADLETYDLAP